jgi:transposase
MNRPQLTPRRRDRLERQLQATRDAAVYRRTLAVLEVTQGRSVAEVARLLRTSRVSVHDWLARSGDGRDPAALLDHRGGNHPTAWTPDLRATLREALAVAPDDFGYQAVEWTADLLREHLAAVAGEALSAATVRRQLHALGYVWKRPRYVLQPDPGREKKTGYPTATRCPAASRGAAVRG